MSNGAIFEYLSHTKPADVRPAFLSYLANLSLTAEIAPQVARAIVRELAGQRSALKLIASENYCSLASQAAMANLLTDKYAEGIPSFRHYEGCENVDEIEAFACQQACKLFGCDHAYVQPHSGADANLIAYWAILHTRIELPAMERFGVKSLAKLSAPDWAALRTALGNQRLLGMDYLSGGHLTHGYRYNVSAKMFDAHSYGVAPDTNRLDYDTLERQAVALKPLILLAGYSSFPRAIDFRRMREIADKAGAVFMVDMAHFAGLVAGGAFAGDTNPVAHAHVVTTTTHKTLRGPRGGMVLCTSEFAKSVDKGCPLVMGGPLNHVIAAKAVALTEALRPEFKTYARAIVDNAKCLANALSAEGLDLVTGGTDNHLILINVHPCGLTGRQASSALRRCGITANHNSLPNDPNGPLVTSGLRLGTPAITTLGMGEPEMRAIARIVNSALRAIRPARESTGATSKIAYTLDETFAHETRQQVAKILEQFPVYPELDLPFLQRHFG